MRWSSSRRSAGTRRTVDAERRLGTPRLAADGLCGGFSSSSEPLVTRPAANKHSASVHLEHRRILNPAPSPDRGVQLAGTGLDGSRIHPEDLPRVTVEVVEAAAVHGAVILGIPGG